MATDSDKTKDPVCGMMVRPDQNPIIYQGMHFVFCSQQCKVRFLANPHLYIGVPGKQAPRQAGMKMLKRRHLHLEKPLSESDIQQVSEHLLAMMGVCSVDVEGSELTITYDLMEATAQQIEAELQQAGAQLSAGIGEQLRRAFIHYLEETEVENLEVKPGFHVHGSHHHI